MTTYEIYFNIFKNTQKAIKTSACEPPEMSIPEANPSAFCVTLSVSNTECV